MGAKVIDSKRYELVPPDGGWGYVIAIGVTINLTTICAFLTSFGMIYKNLFIELSMDSTSITFLNGVSSFCIAVSGLGTTPLLKVLSIRQLGFIAAVIFNVGNVGMIFVKSQFTFFICFGILQSVGHGIIFNLSCTMLSYYFVKRRLLLVSVTQSAIGFASLFSPQFIKWTLEKYGFKGTILFMSAVTLQNIIAMTLMQPVQWHMKRVPVTTETKSLLTLEEKPLTKDEIKKPNKADIDKVPNVKHEEQQYRGIKKVVNIFIDLSIVRSFLLSNASFGTSLCISAEFTFIALLPQALYALGWTEADVAWVLSLNAMGDLVTRISFIFLSNLLLNVGSHQIYVIGLVFALITRLGMLWSNSKTGITIFIALMGISRCTIMMLLQIVVADTVDQVKFSSAMGITMLLFGFFNIVFGTIVGAIRDFTGSYSTAFYLLSSCFGLISILWTIELAYNKKNKHKRIPEENDAKA